MHSSANTFMVLILIFNCLQDRLNVAVKLFLLIPLVNLAPYFLSVGTLYCLMSAGFFCVWEATIMAVL